MVPLATADLTDHLQTVQRSVDYAIVDLTETARDPLALSYYLWVVRRRRLTLSNSDSLASWGENWVRDVLLEDRVSQRADEEIASAALAAVALYGDRSQAEIAGGLGNCIDTVLQVELESGMPLGQPGYAAILLLAASLFGGSNPRLESALEKVRNTFLQTMPNGRLFGLAPLGCALANERQNEALSGFLQCAQTALQVPQSGYENRVYLAELLCVVDVDIHGVSSSYEEIADVVIKSPAWSHLLVGEEDVPEIGDRHTVVPISHLLRAALLDVTAYLGQAHRSHLETKLDERYRGRHWITTSAFLFFLGVTVAFWWVYVGAMLAHAENAKQFWILHNYKVASASDALGFVAGVVLGSYMLPASLIMLKVLASVLLGSSVISEARVLDRLIPAIRAFSKFWFLAVPLALAIALLAALIVPGITHAIT